MSTMITEIHEAFKETGVSENSAKRASETMATMLDENKKKWLKIKTK